MKVIKKGLDLMSDEEQDRVGELQIKPSKEEVKELLKKMSEILKKKKKNKDN